jgi:sterol desaturase/sphingolipid hydroxylase (fatty acid hydroxylase superfamily)
MDLDPDSVKLGLFVGGFGAFLLIETLFPLRAQVMPRWRRLRFHTGVALANTLMMRLLVYVPLLLWLQQVQANGWGISQWLGLSGLSGLLISVVVLDAFNYFWHRANHRIGFLWRFHKAHHSDPEMDLSTSLRFHPGELLISALVKAGWIVIWGPMAIAWLMFEALVSLCAQFHHSNIDFPDRIERWLSHLLVTPRYHAAHHAVDQRYGNRNFATFLSLWDRLFGTYAQPEAGGRTTLAAGTLGLPEARDTAFSARAWLREPVHPANLHLSARPPDKTP